MITAIASPHERKDIEWLGKAVGDDDTRPFIQAYHRIGDALVTTDGFCAFAIEAPECTEEFESNESGHIMYQPCEAALSWEKVEARRIPFATAIPKGEPKAVFCVNPQFLIKTLEGFLYDGKSVAISVYESGHIEVQGMAGMKRYAVIMGIHKESLENTDLWRPELEDPTKSS